ncbi:MAG: nucleoside triphosphate pyrophosphohydrolase [Candidatus Marinimicrobia bacterium]|jgi:MazG family protein|nr:nucleoside triphosphate pyrophosphohydrolase [Candidatus Neomarinimicrobiota bacterium]MAQ73770.1 nucleoside triphosphate pyrophosphohydrolase [Candidatus Neomarinimicrobiota bacterium]|tara:strand:+ start:2297 stop:3073 length:777 start_codon:yes stop_codon:yes gene_type:complete
MGEIGNQFEELVNIVSRLRAPDGCPWDREQTNHTLLPYFVEEVYEAIESIDDGDWDLVKEELGDILLHIVFQASIAEDEKNFQIIDSLDNINKKLINRHPHVFGDAKAEAAFHAKQNWEAEKHKEKGRESRLDGVPNSLPSLIRAQRLQQKASYAGFDWEKIEQVWGKVNEEIIELKEAEISGNNQHIEEEMGDLLFAIVNLSRHLNISSEDALRKTNQKFIRRFKKVEEGIKAKGKKLNEASLEEMDSIWNEAKHNE